MLEKTQIVRSYLFLDGHNRRTVPRLEINRVGDPDCRHGISDYLLWYHHLTDVEA